MDVDDDELFVDGLDNMLLMFDFVLHEWCYWHG